MGPGLLSFSDKFVNVGNLISYNLVVLLILLYLSIHCISEPHDAFQEKNGTKFLKKISVEWFRRHFFECFFGVFL